VISPAILGSDLEGVLMTDKSLRSRGQDGQLDPEAVIAVLKRAVRDRGSMDLSWIQPVPRSDGWTLAPDALQLIMRVVEYLQPGHLLEFGSGLSTRALVRACGHLSHSCAISTVDHDPEFGLLPDAVREQLPPHCQLEQKIVPVVVRLLGGKDVRGRTNAMD
jgi:hypothetical protein